MNRQYTYTKAECPHCGRKILVERTLVGVSHTAGVYATCLDCLMKKGLSEEYKKKNPEYAKDIEDWYNSSTPSVNQEEV